MKNLFLSIIFLCCSFLVNAQSTSPRFGTTKNQDNTGRVLTYAKVGYTFTATVDTIKLFPRAFETYVAPDSLADSLMVKFSNVTKSYYGDKVVITVVAKTGTQKVKFASTNISVGATISCLQNKRATIVFVFDGVKWVELCRFVEA
jgi:hypothetical protein